jgi:hypothetical protein
MEDKNAVIRVTVLDRSIGCACRPGEQRGLMVLKRTLHGVRKEFGNRIQISYHAYDQQPEAFEEYEHVVKLIRSVGFQVLPVTLINGAIEKTGTLPSLQDLRAAIMGALE